MQYGEVITLGPTHVAAIVVSGSVSLSESGSIPTPNNDRTGYISSPWLLHFPGPETDP